VRRRRFDGYEVILISMLAVVTGASLMTIQPDESGPGTYWAFESESYFERLYGATEKSSANAEEWLIRDFFADRRGGTFLDVGASHYRKASNTYFLETHLGWSGLAIEAQSEYAADYARYRPHTTFVTAFVDARGGEMADFFIPPPHMNLGIASGKEGFVEDLTGIGEVRQVPTVTLNNALENAGIDRVDLLSLDIELYEPRALEGFDIRRYRPSLACVEAHLPVRQTLIDYFARHDYVVVGRYLRVDASNLYFMPADRTIEPRLPPEVLSHRPAH
jgi:FkbM family methyltransferase